jgi:hypothetical protein
MHDYSRLTIQSIFIYNPHHALEGKLVIIVLLYWLEVTARLTRNFTVIWWVMIFLLSTFSWISTPSKKFNWQNRIEGRHLEYILCRINTSIFQDSTCDMSCTDLHKSWRCFQELLCLWKNSDIILSWDCRTGGIASTFFYFMHIVIPMAINSRMHAWQASYSPEYIAPTQKKHHDY